MISLINLNFEGLVSNYKFLAGVMMMIMVMMMTRNRLASFGSRAKYHPSVLGYLALD